MEGGAKNTEHCKNSDLRAEGGILGSALFAGCVFRRVGAALTSLQGVRGHLKAR